MPEIRFTCSGCQQSLEAPEDMGGDIIECPTCQQQITIPRLIHRTDPEPQKLNIDWSRAVSASGAHGAPRQRSGAQSLQKCPSCGSDMKTDAVLCVKCGFHMEQGKRLTTDFS